VWAFALRRGKFRAPASLVIVSLFALSFISLYHSVSDTSILVLALCWAINAEAKAWTWPQKLTCVVLALMMLPGQSALLRIAPYLSSAVTDTWWWKLVAARYFIWLLLTLDVALLAGLIAYSPAPPAGIIETSTAA
jgi:hypothetical protein